jgi:chromosome segregation ATPase
MNTATQLATDLDEAKTQVTTHQSQIEELQTQISEHETGLATAQNRVKELTKELCKQLGVPYTAPKTKGGTSTGKTRTFKPEALANIKAGQKKRWEKFHANKTQQQDGNTTIAAGANANGNGNDTN